MVWLPPPSFAGDFSAGYGPKEYFNLNNSYGSFIQQHAMLKELLRNGVEPVADIVINHRDGTNGWVNFTKPAWGLWAICRGDEAFTNSASGVAGTPIDQRGAEEEAPTPYAAQRGSTYAYDVFRDVDHSNKQVRKDIIKYLLQLKSAGYRGWRYDMVHGYHARWIGLYNKRTNPTFSVGEYDWDKHAEQRGWIWYTATEANTLETACSVFDFTTQFSLKGNKGNYAPWFGLGNGIGMIADNTDNQPWKQRSVTFLENHDTGFRTNEDGSTEEHHEFDSFANNWEVEQGYAYILTHPGVPCVYWKHYFDWGSVLQSRIKGLINARKVAGIHSGSSVDLQTNARQNGVYAARIVGKRGELFVRVGGSDNEWVPSLSDYHDYREYAAGEGWKVWVKLPGNPSVQQAPLNAPLPVPRYRAAATFNVPDAWLSNN
jgi:alpha-amylase